MPVILRPKVAANKRYVINQMVELRYDPYDPNVFYVPTDGSPSSDRDNFEHMKMLWHMYLQNLFS